MNLLHTMKEDKECGGEGTEKGWEKRERGEEEEVLVEQRNGSSITLSPTSRLIWPKVHWRLAAATERRTSLENKMYGVMADLRAWGLGGGGGGGGGGTGRGGIVVGKVVVADSAFVGESGTVGRTTGRGCPTLPLGTSVTFFCCWCCCCC